MNKNDVKLIKNMIKRIDIMVAKERNYELEYSLKQAAGNLTNVLFEYELETYGRGEEE